MKMSLKANHLIYLAYGIGFNTKPKKKKCTQSICLYLLSTPIKL